MSDLLVALTGVLTGVRRRACPANSHGTQSKGGPQNESSKNGSVCGFHVSLQGRNLMASSGSRARRDQCGSGWACAVAVPESSLNVEGQK